MFFWEMRRITYDTTPQKTVALGGFTQKTCVCVHSNSDIILLLRQQYYLNLYKHPDSWIHDTFVMCLCKPLKQYKENPAMQL